MAQTGKKAARSTASTVRKATAKPVTRAASRRSPAQTATRQDTIAESKPVARPAEDSIRRRAFEIYLARGDRPGTPEQDWLRAEAELAR